MESIQQCKTSSGFGCILAHSMGLGKTIQMISFIDIFMRFTAAKCVLVIVPINTLQNWVAEFNMWLPTKENVEERRKEWQKEKEEVKRLKEQAKLQSQNGNSCAGMNGMETGMNPGHLAYNADDANKNCGADKQMEETDSLMDFLTSLTSDTEKKDEKEVKEQQAEEKEEDETDPFADIETRQFPVHVVNDNLKTNAARGKVVG